MSSQDQSLICSDTRAVSEIAVLEGARVPGCIPGNRRGIASGRARSSPFSLLSPQPATGLVDAPRGTERIVKSKQGKTNGTVAFPEEVTFENFFYNIYKDSSYKRITQIAWI